MGYGLVGTVADIIVADIATVPLFVTARSHTEIKTNECYLSEYISVNKK